MSGAQLMVVLIVTIAIVGGIIKARIKAGDTPAASRDNADAQRMRDEIRSLRERVQVLERVITDSEASSHRLEREIDALRDTKNV